MGTDWEALERNYNAGWEAPAPSPLTPAPQEPRASTVGDRLVQNLKKFPGELAREATSFTPLGIMAGSLLPWSKAAALPGVLGKVAPVALGAAQGAAQGAVQEGTLKGAGKGAVGGALLPAAMAVAGPLAKHTGAAKSTFETQAEQQLVEYLKKNNPAATGKDLFEMLYGQDSRNAVRTAYDKVLADVVQRGAGQTIQVPADAAKQMGMIAGEVSPGQMVPVDAAEAAKAVTGRWRTGGWARTYRDVQEALDHANNIGDPAGRQAYKVWAGLKAWADRFNLFGGKDAPLKFDVVRAQQSLGMPKASEELLRRGLQGDVQNILLPTGEAITKGNLRNPATIAGMAIGGTGLGNLFPGGAGLAAGGIGGGLAGGFLGQRMPWYSHVPVPPATIQRLQSPLAQSFLATLGSAGVRNAVPPEAAE